METMVAIMLLSLCCMVLCISLFVQQRSFAKERENYINRIMAKSNTEYISMKKATENIKAPTPTNLTAEEILGEDYKRFNGVLN